MAKTIQDLRDLVAKDRQFRGAAIADARTVFAELVTVLRSLVPMLGESLTEYPIELDDENPDHLVLMVGPKAIHVCFRNALAVRKHLVELPDGKVSEWFHEFARRPDHESADHQSVAIAFVRSTAIAFRQRNPGKALEFASIYVTKHQCTVDTRRGTKDISRQEWTGRLPNLLASVIYDGLSSGISTWPGIGSVDYEAVLETRQLGLGNGLPIRRRAVGFEPFRRDEDTEDGSKT